MNGAPVLLGEKLHIKWPFSERLYKTEYKTFSESREQIDAGDIAHVKTKGSSRFGGLSPSSWTKSQLAMLTFVIAAVVQSKLHTSCAGYARFSEPEIIS